MSLGKLLGLDHCALDLERPWSGCRQEKSLDLNHCASDLGRACSCVGSGCECHGAVDFKDHYLGLSKSALDIPRQYIVLQTGLDPEALRAFEAIHK